MTFWVTVFGSMVVVLLHLFPWRIAFGLAGIASTGPQNWILRVVKERNQGPSHSPIGRLEAVMES